MAKSPPPTSAKPSKRPVPTRPRTKDNQDKPDLSKLSVDELNDLGYNADGQRLDRPFKAADLKAAEELVARYRMSVDWHEDERLYFAGSPDFNNGARCGHGKTEAAAIKMAREGLVACVATLLEDGHKPPAPASDQRDRQINVRVSGHEKQQIERAARRQGFRGVGDFLRHAALSKC